MVNQVIIVGRLTKEPETETTDKGKKYSHVTLAVPRAYKNSDGIYETDFIRCTLWDGIASNTKEYCHKGDLIGIKGRIQVNSYEDDEGNTKYATDVVAEKVTFLSSKSNEVIQSEEE